MATIVTDLHCDLTQNVKPQFLHGNLFSQDNAANTINVHVFNNGEPAALGGSISANVIRSDGATVAVSGAIDGNKAYIILPQACYAVPGVIKIIVKNTENTTVTTIAAVVANVYASSTDTVVDPGTIIPSVAALIAEIEAAVDSIPVDYSGLLATIAADYSSSKTYPIVGMYAWQGGVLKRNIVPITTAETYTAAHWTNAVIGDDLSALKGALSFDEYLINNGEYTIKVSDLVSGQWYQGAKITAPTRACNNNLFPVRKGMTISYSNTTFDTYFAVMETPTSTSYIQTIGWETDGIGTVSITKNGYLVFIIRNHSNTSANVDPADYDSTVTIITNMNANMTLKAFAPAGSTFSLWDDMPQASYYNGSPTKFSASISDSSVTNALRNDTTYQVIKLINRIYLTAPVTGEFYIGQKTINGTQYWKKIDIGVSGFEIKGAVPTNTDLDTIKETGIWFLDSARTYTHNPLPSGYGGMMLVFRYSNNSMLQIASKAGSGELYTRASLAGNFPSTWGTGGTVYNNTYTSEHYENSYEINCSPNITTDTNNYLASTGDTTDRTGDIQTMLNTTGVCHLGPGTFYTTGIEVPTNGILDGCGNKSVLILADSVTTGYAVKLKTNSSVRNLMIRGASAAITPSSTVGTRHGVLFEGTSDAESSPVVYYRASVSNCMIVDFTGGGITMNNTGKIPSENMLISDCFIVRCGAGINIAYISEFHRITNVTAQGCYYGCIDNGGNNNFANCDFSTNKVGLLIDNSTGQSPNNSHGTFSACTFNHTDNTYSGGSIVSVGTAIKILGASAGEIFTGCQIFFGGIEIDDSVGIRFIGANIGRMVPISVTDSTVVVFDDCTMYDGSSSPLTQSGNTRLEFNKCYLRNGTEFDPMA